MLTHFGLTLIFLGLLLSDNSIVRAYDVDTSTCGPVAKGTSYIERAVADAHAMAVSGMNAITRGQRGDARAKLWQTNKPVDFNKVNSKFLQLCLRPDS